MQRAVVALNGDWEGLDYYKDSYVDSCLLVAADGGANYLFKMSLIPDAIIGDLDSVDKSVLGFYLQKGVDIKKYPADKDETDSYLAIKYAMERCVHEVVLWGALGRRIDHTLANIHLLRLSFEKGIPVLIDEPNLTMFVVNCGIRLSVERGTTISILPFTDKVFGIRGKGVKYPLENAVMEIGFPYGVSNIATTEEVEITLSQGALIVVAFKKGEKSVIPHRFL